jgi:hypothetical protein
MTKQQVPRGLDEIEVLYRDNNGSMSLWGIPYRMNAAVGQNPGHLRSRMDDPLGPWVWLGSPGWWGSMTPECMRETKAWLAELGDMVPTSPGEYTNVHEC